MPNQYLDLLSTPCLATVSQIGPTLTKWPGVSGSKSKWIKWCSLVAYSTHDHIGIRKLTASTATGKMMLKDETTGFKIDLTPKGSVNGPLNFVDYGKGQVLLIICIYDELVCSHVNIDIPGTPITIRRTRPEWSEVPGLFVAHAKHIAH